MAVATVLPVVADLVALRAEFARLRHIATEHWAEPDAWMDAVRKLLPEQPSPQDWVDAARRATTKCSKCSGSGVFVKSRLNSYGQWQPCAPEPCFQCEGKGSMDQADYRRCWGYWRYGYKVSGN